MVDVPVEVKKAFKRGRTKKQYRIEVYTINDDNTLTYEFTIGNDNLVKESVNIDERMCSDRYLKFGLCEGSSMEFQYFGMDSITGKELKVYLDVWYDDGNGGAWYPIMMGYYEVDASSTQFSTGIRKVTAFNKLQSKYLNQSANALIDETFGDIGTNVSFYDIRRLLLDDFEIKHEETTIPVVARRQEGTYPKKCGNAAKVKAKYGIDTPWSWAMICNDNPTQTIMNMYPFCLVQEWKADIDPDKAYYFSFVNDYDEIEEGIYNQIKDLFDLSMSTSGQTFADNMFNSYSYTLSGVGTVTYNGWHDFFGIILVKEDNTKEIFSGMARRKGKTGVVGSFKDLSHKTIHGCKEIQINVPYDLTFTLNTSDPYTTPYASFTYINSHTYYYYLDNEIWREQGKTQQAVLPVDYTRLFTIKEVDLTQADMVSVDPVSLADITLRDALSAVYELSACYGQINRETDLFGPVELDQSGLYPSETLYPADNLYPNGNTGGKAIHPYPSEYQKLWTDTVGVQSFRYLRITYKTIEDGNEVEKVLQRTINEHGTQNYNMSDNWLFRNLVWTSAQVGEYADAMVAKMENIRWFPFEMWSVGLPYVETGDAIEIADKEGNTYTTYILQRQLRGIQNLQDTYINGELDVF